jgi:hypothetical protein
VVAPFPKGSPRAAFFGSQVGKNKPIKKRKSVFYDDTVEDFSS